MKRRYKIDYSKKINAFAQIRNVRTDLIYGNLSYVPKPFISYVIPVYKRADLLEETLESVLNQRPVDFSWDIVVVDNEAGGENDTERLIRRINHPRILYYRNQKNVGVDGNYNRCIETARGKWVAMLHGDDLIMRDHLCRMGALIQSKAVKNARYPLAYICQKYVDFSDPKYVYLDRTAINKIKDKQMRLLLRENAKGKVMRERQSYGILTGFFAAVPSFGTIMNREIMIREGGFVKEFGICEDVIIPFKLAERYGVYMAPNLMGYHRFSDNESMKSETILKIYASMVDFREYMYSRNILSQIWGNFARDILNRNLQNYCIGLSRFSDKRLKSSDFDSIYKPVVPKGIKLLIFRAVIGCFNIIHRAGGYDRMIQGLVKMQGEKIEKAMDKGNSFLIYGAGGVARVIIPYIKKTYKGIRIEGCMVSSREEAVGKIHGMPVRCIKDIDCARKDLTVITATELWQYQSEMNVMLKKKGVMSVINLL